MNTSSKNTQVRMSVQENIPLELLQAITVSKTQLFLELPKESELNIRPHLLNLQFQPISKKAMTTKLFNLFLDLAPTFSHSKPQCLVKTQSCMSTRKTSDRPWRGLKTRKTWVLRKTLVQVSICPKTSKCRTTRWQCLKTLPLSSILSEQTWF